MVKGKGGEGGGVGGGGVKEKRGNTSIFIFPVFGLCIISFFLLSGFDLSSSDSKPTNKSMSLLDYKLAGVFFMVSLSVLLVCLQKI